MGCSENGASGTHPTCYFYAGSSRVAMRKNNTVYYLLGDHLGSTSVTTDQNGQNPVKQYYLPWGEVRYSSGTLQTKYTFTGQYSNVSDFGLMYYNARWYDSALGRFTSADSIVPQPGNPKDWDRYAYTKNNPVNFFDPSGHFSEGQLEDWFGEEWRKLFSDGWQDLLLAAEFGDAIVNGTFTAILASEGNSLVGWDIYGKTTLSIFDLQNGTGELALYRSQMANLHGGPTQNDSIITFGEFIDPANIIESNIYLRILGDPEHTPNRIQLPALWYMGGNTHVEVDSYFAGFQPGFPDYLDFGTKVFFSQGLRQAGKSMGKTGIKALGGWLGIALMIVDVASWATYDTSYTIIPGQGQPPIAPIPTPE